jgi:hypothetical protein
MSSGGSFRSFGGVQRSFSGGQTLSRPSFTPRASFTGRTEGSLNRVQTDWHPAQMPILHSSPSFVPARTFQAPVRTERFTTPVQRQQFVAPVRSMPGSIPVQRAPNQTWLGDRDDRLVRSHPEPDWDDVGTVSPFVYGYGYPYYGSYGYGYPSYGYSYDPSYSMGYSSPMGYSDETAAGYVGPTCTTAYDQGYNDGASGFPQQPVCSSTCSGAYDQGYSEGYYSAYGVWPDIQAC